MADIQPPIVGRPYTPTGQPSQGSLQSDGEPNSVGTVTPAGAQGHPPVSIETQVEQLSPEQAKARLAELRSDPKWSQRLLDHWDLPGSTERAWFDALTERMDDRSAEPPKSEPTEAERAMAALEPPERVEDYKLVDYGGREIKLDAENEAIVRGEILPIAHALGLSQSDIEMAIYGVMKPMTFQQCEAHLKRSWGSNFETNLDLFRTAMTQNPKARQLVERFPDSLGNNAFLIQRVVESFRRRQGKR